MQNHKKSRYVLQNVTFVLTLLFQMRDTKLTWCHAICVTDEKNGQQTHAARQQASYLVSLLRSFAQTAILFARKATSHD